MMNKCFLVSLLVFFALPTLAAFPTVESKTSGDVGSGTNPHAITLPATITADAVIIACIGSDGNVTHATADSGVSELGEGGTGTETGGVSLACYCKAADGTEDSTTWDINHTPDNTESFSYTSYSIISTFDNTCSSVETTTFATAASSTDANPPDLNPTGWGTEDTLWLEIGAANDGPTPSTFPADCTANQESVDDSVSGVSQMACTREFNSANWDPAAFVFAAAFETVAANIAIRPAAAASKAAAVRRAHDY